MLRKFSNLFHKELFRVSSQHSKVLPFTNDGLPLSSTNKSSRIVEKSSTDGKRTTHKFDKLKVFIDQYQKKFHGGTRTNDVKEDFVVWCTGVLTISSAIVGHKWFHRNQQKQDCPLHNFSIDVLQSILLEPLNRSHAVLAINATDNPCTKPKKKETASKEAKLEDLFKKYQATTHECNGTFLNELGVKYGRTNNHKQAFAMFKEASNFGNLAAFYNMAISYEKGVGINKSYSEAANCYKKAGDSGHAKALFNLSSLCYAGLLGENEISHGFEFAKKAADLGLCKAQLFVGLRYTKEKDWENAFKYFKMAAEQKDASSIYNLALCYENGYGTKKNITKALEKFHEAADKGNVLAQYHLGECCEYGQTASKNLEEALYWFQRAAYSGHPEAQSRVEYIEYEIAQKNEDDLLTIFESNTLLQVLKPIKNVIRSSTFHKSTSMPSLQKLLCDDNRLQLLEKTSLNRSTLSLCL